MFSRLFSAYPTSDAEASIEAYMGETRDIHPLVISHALAELRDKPVYEHGQPVARRFAPSVQEVRRACAVVIRRWTRQAQGKDPDGYSPQGTHELDANAVSRWIARGTDLMEMLPALTAGRARGQIGAGER